MKDKWFKQCLSVNVKEVRREKIIHNSFKGYIYLSQSMTLFANFTVTVQIPQK
jgi:hypothetical protein